MDDFDKWCNLKRKLDLATPSLLVLPKEKEVWMCNLGRNIGYEENGKGSDFLRPVLILKVFNRHRIKQILFSIIKKIPA